MASAIQNVIHQSNFYLIFVSGWHICLKQKRNNERGRKKSWLLVLYDQHDQETHRSMNRLGQKVALNKSSSQTFET